MVEFSKSLFHVPDSGRDSGSFALALSGCLWDMGFLFLSIRGGLGLPIILSEFPTWLTIDDTGGCQGSYMDYLAWCPFVDSPLDYGLRVSPSPWGRRGWYFAMRSWRPSLLAGVGIVEKPVRQEIKRRKRHRRKHFENQEPCIMRGVYFKNMKWQAAIKVDKKQIHLGTVGSQEAAGRLYDRAAFMCGREPNFELSEEEKQELRQYKWDEFLTMTRHAITSKKHQKRLGAGSRKNGPPQSNDWDGEQGVGGFSAPEDIELEMSVP
ncbi:hypothetical protein HHK36_022299 [Tetracentron sinense]|uniref:AP2/ERF domain-containing protein n=1 Tax=Tetracentron sinense TaxID=13715 RepID=A0A834YMQ5_TETSI|nr:hypothetical protein HHK36_022299 [Tetracentron sinense]